MVHQDFESHVRSALRDLAGLASEPDWEAMEARLLETFSQQQTHASTPHLHSRRVRSRWSIAAAATVLLAAAITFYPTRPSSDRLPTPEPATVPLVLDVIKPLAPPVRTDTRRPPSRLQQQRPLRRAPAGPETLTGLNEFVALPAAVALPDFESGRIVRVEIPLAMLPAYGLHISPDAMPAAVKADFLVGQDGLPRAIRLASTTSQ